MHHLRFTIDDLRLRASGSGDNRQSSIVNRQSAPGDSAPGDSPGAKCRRGFTLIETIAAVVILTIAIPPLLWSVRQAQVHRVNPMLASKARWLATEKLEDLVADRHSTTRGYGYLVSANYPAEGTISGYAGFTRAVSLVQTGPDLVTAGTGYMRVTVTVAWTDSTGVGRSLAIATVLTDY